jgi:hypothetical protein
LTVLGHHRMDGETRAAAKNAAQALLSPSARVQTP